MVELTEDQLEAFRDDLTALTKKHGIVIGGCGCCGSPFMYPLSEANNMTGHYTSGGSDNLGWE